VRDVDVHNLRSLEYNNLAGILTVPECVVGYRLFSHAETRPSGAYLRWPRLCRWSVALRAASSNLDPQKTGLLNGLFQSYLIFRGGRERFCVNVERPLARRLWGRSTFTTVYPFFLAVFCFFARANPTSPMLEIRSGKRLAALGLPRPVMGSQPGTAS